MTGWAALATAAGLFAVATVGLNASLWLRGKAMAAARGGWTADDYVTAMAERGISPAVSAAIGEELRGYYMAGLTLRLDDRFDAVLRIDAEELAFLTERLFARLYLPPPAEPPLVAELVTVADLADYLNRQATKR